MQFYDLDDPDRYLYHYTTTSAALGSILPSGLIRFGLARYTNDPRESKSWRFTLSGGDGSKLVAINTEATDLLQRTTKLLCLTRDDPNRAAGDEPDAVFGRGFAHSAMWHHYAGGHSGVCLVFDRAMLTADVHSEFDGRELYEGAVTYADSASDEIDAFTLDGNRIEADGLEPAVNDHFEDWHPVLFFRKNTDWADEFEFRWLLRSRDPAPEFVSISGSLCGIVVGERFPTSEHDALEYHGGQLGSPPIASCHWNNGYPDLAHWGGGSAINMRARFRVKPGPAPPASLRVTW